MKSSAIYSDKDHKSDVYTEPYNSPIGSLCIGASDLGLIYIKLIHEVEPQNNPNNFTSKAIKQLSEYFEGNRKQFDVELDFRNNTPFSISVWNRLIQIPYGETISYSKLSIALGNIKAIRAVANANGRNPIPFIVPCHRVIGTDGSLTGFALGLDLKRQLLTLENQDGGDQLQLEL